MVAGLAVCARLDAWPKTAAAGARATHPRVIRQLQPRKEGDPISVGCSSPVPVPVITGELHRGRVVDPHPSCWKPRTPNGV